MSNTPSFKKFGRVAAGSSLLVGGAGAAVGTAAFTALFASPASAAITYTVLNTNDDGVGSLRAAIVDANTNPGADIIVFDAAATGTITLTTGQLEITDDVDLQGPGASTLSVSGNNANKIFYIYNNEASLTVTISGLTLTDGFDSRYGGGAIANWGNDLTISSVAVTGNNTTEGGGGILAGYPASRNGRFASLTIIDSEITGNEASLDGGGINFQYQGNLTIQNSTISNNTAGDQGGGIYVHEVDLVSITDSTISGNTNNQSGGGGIKLYQATGFELLRSTVSENINTGNDGGGLYLSAVSGPVNILSSTISGNHSIDGAGIELYNNGFTTIANTTIANNVGDSEDGDGGALYSFGSSSGIIAFSTISGNSSNDTGGVRFDDENDWTIESSIIDGNTDNNAGAGSTGTAAQDLYFNGDSLTINNSIIEGVIAGSTTPTMGAGNVLGQSAGHGLLASNGGPTQTMAITNTSPAFNAAQTTVPTFDGNQYDQRGTGFARIAFGQADMGAFEVQEPPAPTTTTSTTTPTEPILPAFTG